jgi:tRNA pseudouridine synthase 10
MGVIEDVERILSYGSICDSCLGRMFGKRSHGLTNRERGRGLRIAYALEKHVPFEEESGSCWICGSLFSRLDLWAERAVAALEGIEYPTFLVGTRVPPLMAESEEMVWTDLSLTHPEPLKAELNREVGKRVSALTKKEVDFTNPDVVVICDLARDAVEVQIRPLFLRGRYCKYERGIPQTRWYCRVCQGEGCPRCHDTGKMYQDSVEELIGRHLIPAFCAKDAILHGSGREDIDARMIGTGRPFIMELVSPHSRTADLAVLEAEINRCEEGRVGVTLEGFAKRADVETIKSKQSYKKYRILVEIDSRVSQDELNQALERLRGAIISQRTPLRVAHRRADLVRERQVIDIEAIGTEEGHLILDVIGQAGLYIKELVSGDEGRTVPSLAALLGRNARVVRIDVLHVDTPGGKDPSSTIQ